MKVRLKNNRSDSSGLQSKTTRFSISQTIRTERNSELKQNTVDASGGKKLHRRQCSQFNPLTNKFDQEDSQQKKQFIIQNFSQSSLNTKYRYNKKRTKSNIGAESCEIYFQNNAKIIQGKQNNDFRIQQQVKPEIQINFYDKFANKKNVEQKRIEIFNKIEVSNLEMDLHFLKENQQNMGLTSLLHLNYLKRSKSRNGQLSEFQMVSTPLNQHKITMIEVQKNLNLKKIQLERIESSHFYSLLRKDKTNGVIVDQRLLMKKMAKNAHSNINIHSDLYKAKLRTKLFTILKKLSKKIKAYGLAIEIVLQKTIVPQSPMFDKSANEFLNACKSGNKQEVLWFIQNNKLLVFEYNHVLQNCFHMAAKRGKDQILYILLNAKGDFDAQDLTGRTPLAWAVEKNFSKCVQILLAAGSNPFLSNKYGDKFTSMSTSINFYFKKAKILKILMHWESFRRKVQITEKESFPFYEMFEIDNYEKRNILINN